jgi:hypothetical protein
LDCGGWYRHGASSCFFCIIPQREIPMFHIMVKEYSQASGVIQEYVKLEELKQIQHILYINPNESMNKEANSWRAPKKDLLFCVGSDSYKYWCAVTVIGQ